MPIKPTAYCLLLFAAILSGCQQESTTTESPGKTKSIDSVLDEYHQAMKSKDAPTMMSLMAEKGLYCGTDPMELWDKNTLSDYVTQAFENPSLEIDYKINRREIRLGKDGKSAIAVDHYVMDVITPHFPVRTVFHLILDENNAWKCNFLSMSLAPPNDGMKLINKLVEAEQLVIENSKD